MRRGAGFPGGAPYKRADRVADRIQAELSDILARRVKDPRVGFVTIMRVVVSDDLGLARVFIRTTQDQKQALSGLRRAAPFIRGALAQSLELRRVPELVFLPDTTTDKTLHLLGLLEQIKRDLPADPSPEPPQTE